MRTSPGAARLATTTIAGKSWRRVRAVDLPLSEYDRWEMAAYAEPSVLGEEIRILQRSGPFADLGHDFRLFDVAEAEPFAVAMTYDEDGRQGEHRLATDPDTITSNAELPDATWEAAVPLNEFVATSREQLV